jgi:GMP synthase PP-ATPase subunit
MMQTSMLIGEAIEALESQIDDTAIIACSGGIDSSVAAVLAHRAVYCIAFMSILDLCVGESRKKSLQCSLKWALT